MFGHLRPKPDARMLRRVAARLRCAPSRCVLVEDTLEHQKAARGSACARSGCSATSAAAFAAPFATGRTRLTARAAEVGVHRLPEARLRVCQNQARYNS